MYQFVETILIKNRKPMLIDLHQQRLERTFNFFKEKNTLYIEDIINNYIEKQDISINDTYKLRFLYNLDANYSIQITPYQTPKIEQFSLIEDNDIEYSFKSTDRIIFDRLKSRAIGEIIIVKNGFVTDTSFSNVIFLKDNIWYTPKTYLFNGVQRQHLIASNQIQEADIKASDIKSYSHIKIINALNPIDNSCTYPIDKITNASYY